MNTTENNKLIANFAGVFGLHGTFDRHWIFLIDGIPELKREDKRVYIHDLVFHTSFDWLMPVALRILSAEFCLECAHKSIHPWHDAKDEINAIKIALERGIEPLYEAVIAFITWYNEQ